MNCPRCFGKGVIITFTEILDPDYPLKITHRENCPECHGTGIIHCCEGDKANDEE
jgi:DnaJ-class molecular chaperone